MEPLEAEASSLAEEAAGGGSGTKSGATMEDEDERASCLTHSGFLEEASSVSAPATVRERVPSLAATRTAGAEEGDTRPSQALSGASGDALDFEFGIEFGAAQAGNSGDETSTAPAPPAEPPPPLASETPA